MASVILSPFPGSTMTTQRPAAIACIKVSISGGTKLTDDRAAALGEAASALVERFAPDAPQAVKNEAVIRLRDGCFPGYRSRCRGSRSAECAWIFGSGSLHRTP